MNVKFRVGDTVQVLTGHNAGKYGTVSNVNLRFNPKYTGIWNPDDCCEVYCEGKTGRYTNIELQLILKYNQCINIEERDMR